MVCVQYILIKEGAKRGAKKVTVKKDLIGEGYYKYM